MVGLGTRPPRASSRPLVTLPTVPIAVSPIGVGRFFSARGLEVMKSEFRRVWLPSLALAGIALGLRESVCGGRDRRRKPGALSSRP